MASFQNVYTHRKVADTASKPCEICYKPTASVLVASENKDFFYVCPGHIKDRKFCTPIIDEAAVAAKKKKEMEAEVEKVKKEFEERQKKKKEKEKEKDKEKDKDKESEEKKDKAKEEDGETEKQVEPFHPNYNAQQF
ncbi:putative UPF0589 protein C32H8.01c [Glarea lozoyensis 74030]|uniref:Putative UPF0589 protein C32H8.01c n=1 Tax=Glarea lozoyensis (strain ATCC 74030 / MF5533) TaxID=1104152 RepID=H0EQN3_GLAL7|nr:putative UPF0589 protein C32H8.01c [Glarea lozoyensis 74030]